MARIQSRRTTAVTIEDVRRMIATCDGGLLGIRDRALIFREALCRPGTSSSGMISTGSLLLKNDEIRTDLARTRIRAAPHLDGRRVLRIPGDRLWRRWRFDE